jgi:hypothetical protein
MPLRKTASRNSCKNLKAIQRLDRKLWPFWPVSHVWSTRPPRHRVAIPEQPKGKRPPETRAKIWKRSNGQIESYGHFDQLVKSSQPDLLVTELRFHINPKENGFRKLVQKFKRDLTVWLKVMAILTRYSRLADHISTSPSSDYIETPRKTASGNSCKNLRAIQRSDRK